MSQSSPTLTLFNFCAFNVQLLGRTINLRSLITERMNKILRENLEFLFDRFESQDLCAIVVSRFTFSLVLLINKKYLLFSCCLTEETCDIWLQELEKLTEVLKHAHGLLSMDLSIDSFSLMLNEMQENISLVSFSSRLASQVYYSFLPYSNMLVVRHLETSSFKFSLQERNRSSIYVLSR